MEAAAWAPPRRARSCLVPAFIVAVSALVAPRCEGILRQVPSLRVPIAATTRALVVSPAAVAVVMVEGKRPASLREVPGRRDVFSRCSAAAAATVAAVVSPDPSLAAQTAAESIRRSAANLPGYGQPDVYYPPYFRGVWHVTRTIAASEDRYLAPLVPIDVTYEARFVTVDGDGKVNDGGVGGKVVADRGYNEASFRAAVRSAVLERLGGDGGTAPPAVRSCDWDASNPNVLTLTFGDGSLEEIRVTKRAAEIGEGGDTLFSSEYRRVTSVGARGIPSIAGSRALTKWRRAEGGDYSAVAGGAAVFVEGIELINSDAAMGDPMGGGMVPPSGAPRVSSKSRIRMEKIK